MAWKNPRINWNSSDVPTANDFNRIEGNIKELEPALGIRTFVKSGTVETGNDYVYFETGLTTSHNYIAQLLSDNSGLSVVSTVSSDGGLYVIFNSTVSTDTNVYVAIIAFTV
jgi:hypothetical protein